MPESRRFETELTSIGRLHRTNIEPSSPGLFEPAIGPARGRTRWAISMKEALLCHIRRGSRDKPGHDDFM
jgi:hypothetical protein